jgi:hypothetical protein
MQLDGAQGIEDLVRSSLALWQFRATPEAKKFATILLVRPDR